MILTERKTTKIKHGYQRFKIMFDTILKRTVAEIKLNLDGKCGYNGRI